LSHPSHTCHGLRYRAFGSYSTYDTISLVVMGSSVRPSSDIDFGSDPESSMLLGPRPGPESALPSGSSTRIELASNMSFVVHLVSRVSSESAPTLGMQVTHSVGQWVGSKFIKMN
jgi:hypothetical protein